MANTCNGYETNDSVKERVMLRSYSESDVDMVLSYSHTNAAFQCSGNHRIKKNPVQTTSPAVNAVPVTSPPVITDGEAVTFKTFPFTNRE